MVSLLASGGLPKTGRVGKRFVHLLPAIHVIGGEGALLHLPNQTTTTCDHDWHAKFPQKLFFRLNQRSRPKATQAPITIPASTANAMMIAFRGFTGLSGGETAPSC